MKTVTFDETKWQLVPKEPTDEMLWREEYPFSPWRQCICGLHSGSSKNEQAKFYRAMLTAAPQHPETYPMTDKEVEQ